MRRLQLLAADLESLLMDLGQFIHERYHVRDDDAVTEREIESVSALETAMMLLEVASEKIGFAGNESQDAEPTPPRKRHLHVVSGVYGRGRGGNGNSGNDAA